MRLKRSNERRGIILMVVLALLTLFAIVGITFVLYSDYEATSARIAREAETQQRADVDPEQALAMFLGQFIYDVPDDTTGLASGLRGHSLARTMYGANYSTIGVPGTNLVPFSGVGRLHSLGALGDDYNLINYTWFSGDNFARDPERFGQRTNTQVTSNAQPNPYVGGNAPYTYPDLNNFFLAAVKADGTVLAPSFHRNYTGFGSLDPSNPNWMDKTNPALKYMVLRPRPAEHPNFPLPDDAGGDVRNLIGGLGYFDPIQKKLCNNDSFWIDIGAPVMTAPDGTKYKMLVAPLIMDLDGRINLGTAGNILGPNNSHVSNQGLGGWEVNLAKVLFGDNPNTPTEYVKLFLGQPTGAGNTRFGKYGSNQVPFPASGSTLSSTRAHPYAPTDINGLNDTTPPYSSPPAPPGTAPNSATNPFGMFPQGYLSGGAELTNHPVFYNMFRPSWFNQANPSDNRVFRASDMEPLLRPNSFAQGPVDANTSAVLSDLIRLCPHNFGPGATSPRFSNLVTTLSMDLGCPAVAPYWWNGMLPTSFVTANPNPLLAPFAVTAPSFPPLPPTAATSTPPSEFGADWRAVSAAMGRIRLNRPLPPYPHMGAGATPPYSLQPPATPSPYSTAYNLSSGPISAQYTAALNARQSLANDIYRRLLAITGVAPVGAPATPLPTDLSSRRWLAQLAVNIVDFIDEDDISTPFNFYSIGDGLPAAQLGATQGNDDNNANPATPQTGANPTFWVFGTELPKVVLNEVLAEAQNSNPTLPGVPNESVKVWLELFNTMPSTGGPNTQPIDAYRVPLYMANPTGAPYSSYRVTIAQNLMPNLPTPGATLPDISANVLGKANATAPFPQSTTDADFAVAAPLIQGGGATQPASNPPVTGAGVDPQSYFLIGPPAPGAPYQDPFVAAGANPGVPVGTPVVRTNSVTYTPVWNGPSVTDERTTGLTVLLRRLANPYLPFNGSPSIPDPNNAGNFIPNPVYNPYVTVDCIQNVPIISNATPPTPYASRGKQQPYAALSQLVVNQQAAQAVNGVTSTFGLINSPLPASGHYDWLVHLDRPVISPMELLHVSAYAPYQLTQRFMLGADSPLPASAVNMFGHYAPWLDAPPGALAAMSCPWWFDGNLPAGASHRLSRLFEFFESADWATGVNALGRIPGKVNINTFWDAEILQALIDANPSMNIPVNPPNQAANVGDPVGAIFAQLLLSRSPSGVPSAADRPFLPLSVGLNVPGGQYPNGAGVTKDGLLRLATNNQQLLFQNASDSPGVHPYLQTQLLTKLYNNVTTRSNTFAVFLTVGFFEVTNTATVPPTLGAEIGRSEGRQVRHRMFAIVDRTNLSSFSTSSNTAVSAPTVTATPSTAFGNATITLATAGPLAVGSQLVIEPGTANEETVIVQSVNAMTNQITANFARKHPNPLVTANPSTTYSVIQRGNPGPRTTAYDPKQDPGVVPYYSIID